jgi:hypothetical protein
LACEFGGTNGDRPQSGRPSDDPAASAATTSVAKAHFLVMMFSPFD